MRPQRCCASATMALMSDSLVTSALKAAAVPWPSRIIAAVSSALREVVVDAQHLGALAARR